MPRKSHRKSRLGCTECKRRHLKCDETKPKCINCVTAHILCPYEAQRPVSRYQITTPESLKDGPGAKVSSTSSPAVASSIVSEFSGGDGGSEINMLHLELLHWWMLGSHNNILTSSASPSLYSSVCIKTGLQHHFLMRQILATSALHLSIARPEKRAFYHHHATELQAEALVEYNTFLGKLDESNILPAFLFSSLTGLHVFCETFNTGELDFNNVLDSLIHCINLMRGVRVVIGEWWECLLLTELRPILLLVDVKRQAGKDAPYSLDALVNLIAEADIGQSSRDAYQKAISELQDVFSVQASLLEEPEDSGESANMIFAWLVTVPKDYVDLLSERRPEALIIFSYYAVLLNNRRNFWAIGHAGRFLIDSISTHLGKHWEKWLIWPKSIIMA